MNCNLGSTEKIVLVRLFIRIVALCILGQCCPAFATGISCKHVFGGNEHAKDIRAYEQDTGLPAERLEFGTSYKVLLNGKPEIGIFLGQLKDRFQTLGEYLFWLEGEKEGAVLVLESTYFSTSTFSKVSKMSRPQTMNTPDCCSFSAANLIVSMARITGSAKAHKIVSNNSKFFDIINLFRRMINIRFFSSPYTKMKQVARDIAGAFGWRVYFSKSRQDFYDTVKHYARLDWPSYIAYTSKITEARFLIRNGESKGSHRYVEVAYPAGVSGNGYSGHSVLILRSFKDSKGQLKFVVSDPNYKIPIVWDEDEVIDAANSKDYMSAHFHSD